MGLYIGNTKYKAIVNGITHKVITKLPYDAEIEYLESTGMQYIDTGIVANENMSFYVDFDITQYTLNNQYGFVFGTRTAIRENAYHFWEYNNNKVVLSLGTKQTQVPIAHNGRHRVEYNGLSSMIVDGVEYKVMKDAITTPTTILAFAIRLNSGNIHVGKVRIYNLKLGNVRDLIPVRVGTTGYLYDKISGKLFSNEGTSNFILGNDKN